MLAGGLETTIFRGFCLKNDCSYVFDGNKLNIGNHVWGIDWRCYRRHSMPTFTPPNGIKEQNAVPIYPNLMAIIPVVGDSQLIRAADRMVSCAVGM